MFRWFFAGVDRRKSTQPPDHTLIAGQGWERLAGTDPVAEWFDSTFW
jgi:hypothetical protein